MFDLNEYLILLFLGHEIGHWKHSHFLKGFLTTITYLFVWLQLLSIMSKTDNLYQSFGWKKRHFTSTFLIFTQIFTPVFIYSNILD